MRDFPVRRRPDVKRVAVLRFDQRTIPVDIQLAAIRRIDVVANMTFSACDCHIDWRDIAFTLKASALPWIDDCWRGPIWCVIAMRDFVVAEGQRDVCFVTDKDFHSNAAHLLASTF